MIVIKFNASLQWTLITVFRLNEALNFRQLLTPLKVRPSFSRKIWWDSGAVQEVSDLRSQVSNLEYKGPELAAVFSPAQDACCSHSSKTEARWKWEGGHGESELVKGTELFTANLFKLPYPFCL